MTYVEVVLYRHDHEETICSSRLHPLSAGKHLSAELHSSDAVRNRNKVEDGKSTIADESKAILWVYINNSLSFSEICSVDVSTAASNCYIYKDHERY